MPSPQRLLAVSPINQHQRTLEQASQPTVPPLTFDSVHMNPLSEYEQPVGAYAFHTTQQENADSIRDQGIKHTADTGSTTSSVETALTELGYDSPFPFDRTAVTYCGVDAAFSGEMLPSHPDSEFASDTVAIVIAVEEITAPMYLADMSLVSDLIDYLHGGAGVMLHADTPDQAVENYRDSITPVETPDDIASHAENIGHAELVVDGDIPPRAIVDVVKSRED